MIGFSFHDNQKMKLFLFHYWRYSIANQVTLSNQQGGPL
tara:strand:- start:1535 stop:1651 length:117 start_codon:yes stop_codon:yes gene_type:complete